MRAPVARAAPASRPAPSAAETPLRTARLSPPVPVATLLLLPVTTKFPDFSAQKVDSWLAAAGRSEERRVGNGGSCRRTSSKEKVTTEAGRMIGRATPPGARK